MNRNCMWSPLRISLPPGLLTLTIAFLSVVCFSAAARLEAQVENGITGSVIDTSGAVIAGANVTVLNTATGVTQHTTTSTVGTYIVIGMAPGHYSVEVEITGFRKTVRPDVTVEVAKISTVDFQMTPGAVTTTVNVTGSEILLNTESPALGTTLEPELVKSAPLELTGLARQLDSFMYLAPGVQGSASSHNINGGLTYENEVQFNGVPVAFVQYQGVQTNINPPYEMVNEFRVNSTTFESEYGLGQGAVTYNMASGTNALHGDGFYILRNQLFDSVGFFPTHFRPDGTPAPPVNQQHDAGFTVNGPVILPKIYNGK